MSDAMAGVENNETWVFFLERKMLWVVQTENSAYALGVHPDGHVKQTYWGKRLARLEDYPAFEEYRDRVWWDWNDVYPVRGEGIQSEHCLKVEFADGVRDVVLHYQGFELSPRGLLLHFQDEAYGLEVCTRLEVFPECDLMAHSTTITNRGEKAVRLLDAKSASFYVPAQEGLGLTHLVGLWAHEFRRIREPLQEGSKILESREGRTSHFHNPVFALDAGAGEEHGDVWFGALAWSGNWKLCFHRLPYENIQVCGGINDWDMEILLEPGDAFSTPLLYFGFSAEGFGTMSRNLHRLQRERLLPREHANQPRKVLYNSWEATGFDVNQQNQQALVERAARIGVELFVVDDGWFGQRNHDRAGLGDWQVNREKFPEGLSPLIEQVHGKGMDFGIWVEPEMVNPDSELYRAHPEWVLGYPERPLTLRRNQLVLNLAREDVRAFVLRTVDGLLTQNAIDFVKWDMNRAVLEAGWQEKEHSPAVWVEYVNNLYAVWKELRARHPNVVFESCSGGGGRVDMGILPFADQFWPSDNTDPFDRQLIQEGFSLFYAPKTMMCWVTDWGGKDAYSLKYRFHVSMMGSLGIGADLNHLSEEELQQCSRFVEQYKEMRNVIQQGELYRLRCPSTSSYTASQYLSAGGDKAVVIVLKNPRPLSMFQGVRVQLRGLEEKALYQLEQTGKQFSGSALMYLGVEVDFSSEMQIRATNNRHFDSAMLVFSKVAPAKGE
ncbi:MAG TPA: alpha-galactosidase [Thermotogota bacterium]|nr:alpha-galactosidase [Thermotogota bacterium]